MDIPDIDDLEDKKRRIESLRDDCDNAISEIDRVINEINTLEYALREVDFNVIDQLFDLAREY